jgi:phage shock protein A
MITTLNARDQRILQLEGDQRRIPQLETQVALYIQQKDNAEAEVKQLRPQIRRLQKQVDDLRRENEAAMQEVRRLRAVLYKRSTLYESEQDEQPNQNRPRRT